MKKCVLYDNKVCNNCGECMRCDLDPNKICDNCGKCLRKNDDDDEFLSMVVTADQVAGQSDDAADDAGDYEGLSEEERRLLEFLDEPIDLEVPDPIEVDPELAAKWERILAEKEEEERRAEQPDEPEDEIAIHGSRKRRPHKKRQD